MGTFFHPITIICPGGDELTVEALVDTGATFTSLPASALRDLGVQPRRQARLRLADSSIREESLGWASVRINDQEEPTPVVFGGEESPPAIGMVTLEIMLLGVDPVEQRLVRVIGWRV
jgi:predicted aspartyl protease